MHTRTLGRPGCHACRHRTGLWTYATEALAGEASAPVRDLTVIAPESGWRIEHRLVAGLDSRPEQLRRVADASLRRLRADIADLGALTNHLGAHGQRYNDRHLGLVGR